MFGIKTRLIKGWKTLKYTRNNLSVPRTDELDALLLCHALEKGMGTKNVKHGFGKEKAVKLVDTLLRMQKEGQIDSFAFQEGLAVLNTYIHFQKSEGIDMAELEQRTAGLNKSFDNSCNGGYYIGGVQNSLLVLI